MVDFAEPDEGETEYPAKSFHEADEADDAGWLEHETGEDYADDADQVGSSDDN
jgi:hypothetical protein